MSVVKVTNRPVISTWLQWDGTNQSEFETQWPSTVFVVSGSSLAAERYPGSAVYIPLNGFYDGNVQMDESAFTNKYQIVTASTPYEYEVN